MKLFGYPEFDEHGVRTLCTYDNEYSHMMMDIRIHKVAPGEKKTFCREGEEIAVLLLKGHVTLGCGDEAVDASRADVFTEGPYAAHVCTGDEIAVFGIEPSEVLVQCTHNDTTFPPRIYRPEDAPWIYSGAKGKFGNTANRQVNTIFDYEHEPWSNMVLGEVLNDRGNWSGYLPHRHPQPECYYFLFDRPEGFGASFVGDHVYKSTDGSFSAIPGGELHPQSAAPGFLMYTCWMIRHLPGKPWLQTDRCEDERYEWMHTAEFDNKPAFHEGRVFCK